MSNFSIGYNYQPNDSVWVVDRLLQSVNHGICVQVDIKIYQDAVGLPTITPTPTPPILDHLVYRVLLDNQRGSVKVNEADIFSTLSDALAALGNDITPTPTATPTATPTVTPTITPSSSAQL